MRSRSRSRYFGASSQGNASIIWRATHSAVGFAVTLIQTRFLRSSRTNNEGIEQAEPDGWDNEQIHRRDIWRVIMQKGAPSLAWRPTSPNHVFCDAGLCDFKSELEQFAVDTRCAPKRVLGAHPPDQVT